MKGAAIKCRPYAHAGRSAEANRRVKGVLVVSFNPFSIEIYAGLFIASRKIINYVKSKYMSLGEEHQRALKPDAQAFDEIRIITVPRYKTSGLSGDEWRISGRIQLFRKGRVIHEDSYRNIETAARFLPFVFATAIDDGKAMYAGEEDFCDQEGCLEKATVIYRLKKHWCNEPYTHEPTEYADEKAPIRMFCERHSKRGDCSFEDADSNYELVSGQPTEPPERDKKQAAFGGVIRL